MSKRNRIYGNRSRPWCIACDTVVLDATQMGDSGTSRYVCPVCGRSWVITPTGGDRSGLRFDDGPGAYGLEIGEI